MTSIPSTASELAKGVCTDLVRRVVSLDNRSFVVTPFKHSDGDFINVYVDSRGGKIELSDRGNTFHKFRLLDIAMTDARIAFVRATLAQSGAILENGTIMLPLGKRPVSRDFVAFCEAIARVTSLEFVESERESSTTPIKMESLVRAKIEPRRGVQRHWVDDIADPESLYKVDFHLNGRLPPKNIFVVTTRERSLMVSAACNFFRLKKSYVPTLAVVDPDASVSGVAARRLMNAVDMIKYGVDDNEDAIVEFATSN